MRHYALLPAIAISLPCALAHAAGPPEPAPEAVQAPATPVQAPATPVQAPATPVHAPATPVKDADDDEPGPAVSGPAPNGPASTGLASTGLASTAAPVPYTSRLVLDTGRILGPELRHGLVAFHVHGEFQLRGLGYSDVPLTPRIGAAPGEGASLGSHGRMVAWLRLRPVFQYSDVLRVVGEIDVPTGMVAGQTTSLVSAALDDYSELAWYGVRPRQLFVEVTTPVGLVRAGQQTSHWGMGLLANDGDHPSLFGDYRRGAVVERLLFATRPLGRDRPLLVAVAGDLVFQDNRARLVGDFPANRTPSDELGAPQGVQPGRDRAFQAVAAVRWEQPNFELGVYGVYRNQRRSAQSTGALTPFDETLEVGIVDVAGRFHAPIPGTPSYLFGEGEAAYVGGSTSYLRNVELLQAGQVEAIRSWGGAARFGAVHLRGTGGEAYGDLVAAVEYGFTTGDADPYDGVSRRFTLDPNHNVGLVLFDHVLAWKTARSATIAQDPRVVNRPAPGLDWLPSEGAIFGATYLHPTVVVRPKSWLDLKGGAVLAQSTADLVDPFQAGALGRYANFDGGRARRHDLGLELDAGVDARVPVGPRTRSGSAIAGRGMVIQLGAEGGVLFPGGAFDDAAGRALPTQFLVNTRLGVQF